MTQCIIYAKQTHFYWTRPGLVIKSLILLFKKKLLRHCTQCTLEGQSDRKSESLADRQTIKNNTDLEFHSKLPVPWRTPSFRRLRMTALYWQNGVHFHSGFLGQKSAQLMTTVGNSTIYSIHIY